MICLISDMGADMISTETSCTWRSRRNRSSCVYQCMEWLYGLYVASLLTWFTLILSLAFFLTAHFSESDDPYDWLMHWLSKARFSEH